ncbi:hypothetical protein PIROE2DRAFT_17056, partial [Piromyces sp. E2]
MLLSPQNKSELLENYALTVESMLTKKSTTYDLFMMNSIYTNYFEPYVENIKYYVSEDLLKKYLNNVTSSFGIIGDKIVGL